MHLHADNLKFKNGDQREKKVHVTTFALVDPNDLSMKPVIVTPGDKVELINLKRHKTEDYVELKDKGKQFY
jgi:hypothetical protein